MHKRRQWVQVKVVEGRVGDGCLPSKYPSSPSNTDGPSGRERGVCTKATLFKTECPTFHKKVKVDE